MTDEETTIKLKESTKSRFREARRWIEFTLNVDLKSDDRALSAILEDWEQSKEGLYTDSYTANKAV